MSRPTAAKGRFPYRDHRTCAEWILTEAIRADLARMEGRQPRRRFTLPPVDLKHAPSLMEQRAEAWRAKG